MNNEIDIILAHYLSGEATQKELHTLDIWLSKSDENEKYFRQMSLLYQYAGETDVTPHFNTEKALAQFKNHIYQKPKVVPFLSSYVLKAAAVVAILLVSAFSLYYFLSQNENLEPMRLMATENSEIFEIFENTNITLFSGSEIIYKSKQEIQLIGKATFKIDSENQEGIVVQAGETYIKDIGTIFTIDATDADKFVSVDVDEGEVWFYTNTNNGVYLKANESAIYDVQRKQFFMELIFHNTSLQQAIDLVKTRYNVDIMLNSNELNDLRLNASFDKNESLENVLNIITLTIAANLSKKDDVYIITFN